MFYRFTFRSAPRERSRDSYGNLAALAAQQWVPIRPNLKDPTRFKIIGKPITRVDLKSKVCGTAVYGLDIQLPDLLRAVVARPPGIGTTLASFDAKEALKSPGVLDVVSTSFGVAVIAETTYEAFRGRSALQITWAPASEVIVSDDDVSRLLNAGLRSDNVVIARKDGDALTALAQSATELSAVYELPYLAHACLEPMNCTAYVDDRLCEVWAPTQAPHGAREAAARVAGLPLDQVVVNVTQMGGGFGRRASHDFVIEAVTLAKKFSRSIQVVWSREDDFRHSPHREASVHALRAVLDEKKKLPTAWYHRVVTATAELDPPGVLNIGPVMGAQDISYDIPNVQVEWRGAKVPIPTTIWRSVGYSYNTFATESFIDELAHEAGIDPVEFRRRLLRKSPELSTCLEKVALLSEWDKAPSQGRYLGVAVYDYSGTYVAQVAEVVASTESVFQVSKVWCVVQCGIVVNPDTVIAQVEGGVIFGLAAAMSGHLSVIDNVIQEDNFHRYVLPRIDEVPEILVEIVSSATPPRGVGEVGVPGIAPAVTNAIFALTGKRLRHLPLLKRA